MKLIHSLTPYIFLPITPRSVYGGLDLYTIRISTPLTLKNLLCCPMKYILTTNPEALRSTTPKDNNNNNNNHSNNNSNTIATTNNDNNNNPTTGRKTLAKGLLPNIDDRDSIFGYPLDTREDLPVYLSIKVPQYGWSTPVIINRDNMDNVEKTVDEPQMFTLINKSGFELNIFYLKRYRIIHDDIRLDY